MCGGGGGGGGCLCLCVCVYVFSPLKLVFSPSEIGGRVPVDTTRSKRRANAKGRYSCQTSGFVQRSPLA